MLYGVWGTVKDTPLKRHNLWKIIFISWWHLQSHRLNLNLNQFERRLLLLRIDVQFDTIFSSAAVGFHIMYIHITFVSFSSHSQARRGKISINKCECFKLISMTRLLPLTHSHTLHNPSVLTYLNLTFLSPFISHPPEYDTARCRWVLGKSSFSTRNERGYKTEPKMWINASFHQKFPNALHRSVQGRDDVRRGKSARGTLGCVSCV